MGKEKDNAKVPADDLPEEGNQTGAAGSAASPPETDLAQPGADAAGDGKPQTADAEGETGAGDVSGKPAVDGVVNDGSTPTFETFEMLLARVARNIGLFMHGEAENVLDATREPLEHIVADYEIWANAATSIIDLIRQIGDRATGPVLATHLKVMGHRETADVTPAEALALDVMAMAVRGLIKLHDDAKAELAKAAAIADPPKPVPIEDTTMESIDDPMDTWNYGS